MSVLAWSKEHRAAIAAAGGIDLLTAAMRAHPAVGGVQDWCGYALGGLVESEEPRAAIAAAGGTVDDGAKCHFTIVMFVGSVGYRKPWWLYRLQVDSAVERDTWLGCIRGGMARYHEHGP